MTRAVFVLGALMALVGLLVISYGIPLVRLEIGWTAIIGGSVAASAGCVILVLGVFLLRLEQMQASLDRLLPVAIPDDLAVDSGPEPVAQAPEPFDLPAPIKPLHPLSPAARVRDLEDQAEQPEPFLAAAPEPPLELTTPIRAEPDWTAEPVRIAEPTLSESAPSLVHAEEEASHPPAVEAPDRVADAVADEPVARPRPSFLSTLLARRGASERRPSPPIERFGLPRDLALPAAEMPALRDLPVDLSSGWDEAGPLPLARHTPPEPEAFEAEGEVHSGFDRPPPLEAPEEPPHQALPEVEPEPPRATPVEPQRHFAEFAEPVPEPPPPLASTPDPLQPIVVGRYNAGSASYVMFSNGMIQVETEQGTHEFASMQDLKVFIERRDARAS